MRNIGFRQDDDVGGNDFQKVPQELNHLVGLRQMQAVRADFFPKKSHRIQSQNPATCGNVFHYNVEKLEEQIWRTPIKIDLIGTESGPHVTLAIACGGRSKERRRTGSDDSREIGLRVFFSNIVESRFNSGDIIQKPVTSCGTVIEHEIEH
jgi:hypothetical protein